MIDGPSFKLLAFKDKTIINAAWNINKNYLNQPVNMDFPAEVEITAKGPLFVEVTATRKVKTGGRITTFARQIRLMNNDPAIYLELDADVHLRNSIVKAEFSTTVESNMIAADGPYITVERPTHPATAREKARWEMACHKWIDLSDDTGGIALLNRGKYGFSLTPDGKGYRLSVIKASRHPRSNPFARDAGHSVFNPLSTAPTDQGAHHIELALLPHRGSWRKAKLWQAGYEFNTPLIVYPTDAHSGSWPLEGSFVKVESNSTYIGSIKRAEDGPELALRLVEAAGRDDTATISFGFGVKIISSVETDLLVLNSESVRYSAYEIKFSIGP